ncbi:MAG TPA: MBL fold metallo-hydrolase [Longimicrobium sp.]|nr:MBL fold metallo-hydrolase [Longimicrobium sp.]
MTESLATLLAPNPSAMTLDGTRTFVVGRARPVVIDPGPDDPRHLDAILRALGGVAPVAILLTHSHADHAAATPALAARTGAPVLLGRGAFREPFDPELVGRWLEEGDTVETDAGTLTAIATPGHAPEHFAFLWANGNAPAGGALFAGDAFMGVGDTTLVSPPEGDLAAYLRTLDRVAAVDPSVLLPAHGPPIVDPRAAVVRYRTHRTERVAQVVRALREAGPSAPPALVDTVYGAALDPRLRTAALGSLLAILGYLSGEGRARENPDGSYALTD